MEANADKYWCSDCAKELTEEHITTEIDSTVDFDPDIDEGWTFAFFCNICTGRVEEVN